jgi:hypothetical protein
MASAAGHDLGKFAVGQQHLGLAVAQHEGNGLGIQPGVQRVEHRAGHGDAEVRLQHGGHVGQHDRHGVAHAHATLGQGAGELAAAGVGVGPALLLFTVNDGGALGIDAGGTLDEAQR